MPFRSLSGRSLITTTAAGSLTSFVISRPSSAEDIVTGERPFSDPNTAALSSNVIEPVDISAFEVPAVATKLNMGTVRHLTFAPIYLAYEKAYYAENGLDVSMSATNTGADIPLLLATNQLQVGLNGIGPAFWNAFDSGMPLKFIASGHEEGNPVVSPLMIAKKACDEATIKAVADIKGKRVSVHALGAIEYWPDAALGTGGLTIDDVSLQYLVFPDVGEAWRRRFLGPESHRLRTRS